jgi:hypothetical protein
MILKELTFEQWGTVSTAILSVIAVVVAIVSSRQTSRQTGKQIEAIKQLVLQQNETLNLYIESEISNATESIIRSKQDIANIEAKIRDNGNRWFNDCKYNQDIADRKQMAENNIINQTNRLNMLKSLQQAKKAQDE